MRYAVTLANHVVVLRVFMFGGFLSATQLLSRAKSPDVQNPKFALLLWSLAVHTTMQAKAQAEFQEVYGQLREKKCTVDTMLVAWKAMLAQRCPEKATCLLEELVLTPEVQGYMDMGFKNLKIAIDAVVAEGNQLARRRFVLEAIIALKEAPAGKRHPQSLCCVSHVI